MIYSIIKPKTPFMKEVLHVSGSDLATHKLWRNQQGSLVIHMDNGIGSSFLSTIGLSSMREKHTLLTFTDEEMKTLFKYFYQKGQLRTIQFGGGSGFDRELDAETQNFLSDLHFTKEKSFEDTEEMAKYYTYITTEIEGPPQGFTIIVGQTEFILRQNACLIVHPFRQADTDAATLDGLALHFYCRIFDILYQAPLNMIPIELVEKEKVAHPLQQANALLNELFTQHGKQAQQTLGMNEQEYEKIKESLLTYTQNFQTKEVYK